MSNRLHLQTDSQQQLIDLQNRLFDLSARNPFIDVKPNRLYFLKKDSTATLEKLYKKANFYKREYDLSTSLQVSVFIKWMEPNRDQFFISPLVYRPCRIKLKRKIEQEFKVEIAEEEAYLINPILRHSFSRFFDVDFPTKITDIDTFCEQLIHDLSTENTNLLQTDDFNTAPVWELIVTEAIGNFNYKKSLLGADYELIAEHPSQQLLDLIEGIHLPLTEKQTDVSPLKRIVPLDFSQYTTVQKAEYGNLLIQGPPGTGKSHTIVALIGNYLAKGKKVLFVSQKRSALEVVYERIKEVGFGHLTAFLNTEKDEKKSFYREVKKSWEKCTQPLEQQKVFEKTDFPLIDFYLSTYTAYNENLSGSIHDTMKLLIALDDPKSDLKANGKVPKLSEWLKNQEFLSALEDKVKKELGQKRWTDAFFLDLNRAVFSEADPILKLEKRLNELISIANQIKEIQEKFGLKLPTIAFTNLSIAASILAMVDRTQLELLNPDSSQYLKFSKLAKKYQLTLSKVKRAEKATQNWTNKPTSTEIIELTDLLKHHESPRGILGILKRNNERLKNAFSAFDKRLTTTAKLQLLEELRAEYHLRSQLQETAIQLKHQYCIENPENEIDQILYLRNKLNAISQTDYLTILEHPERLNLIRKLSEVHPKIQNFNHLSRFIFEEPVVGFPEEVYDRLLELKENLLPLKIFLADVSIFYALPKEIQDFIRQNPGTVQHLTAIVAYHNLLEQTRFEPEFKKLSARQLQSDLDQKLRIEKQQFKAHSWEIKAHHHQLLREKEKLLATPASKLSDEEKTHKKALRKSKKTLLHEMNKSQRHLPVKEFIEQSWEYLKDMQPIWIMNPLAVSERLPCQSEIFDVVIFDESSQIPLEDAIPTVYRAKQTIVVGDDKQMPPSRFFTTSTEGSTLLDQADKTYTQQMLKWHYRSEHPDLIAFSNRYFYDNELLVPPPVRNENPIDFVKVEGVFEDRTNKMEAKKIAEEISKIGTSRLGDYGIIAFSKNQENEIRKALRSHKVPEEELLIRNLENVQGIEKEHIWISVGYAPDKNGVFRLNFGPVNQQNGINRLNVLFSRARKSIRLFSSIYAEDVGYSDNPAVMCLKDYLSYAFQRANDRRMNKVVEADKEAWTVLQDPNIIHYQLRYGSSVDCYIHHDQAKVLLLDPCLSKNESNDLLTVYNLLKGRFKAVKIMLSADYRKHPESFEKEMKDFFLHPIA
ncbi:MAG: AAA domain-containing protein [Crocinitomicaceae bacterium]